jgi:hypothetical protein
LEIHVVSDVWRTVGAAAVDADGSGSSRAGSRGGPGEANFRDCLRSLKDRAAAGGCIACESIGIQRGGTEGRGGESTGFERIRSERSPTGG